VIEVIGLVARIVLEVVFETFPSWGFSGRRTYREYVRGLPPGEKPLGRRAWRAAERSARRHEEIAAPDRQDEDR
jgi:hypothetical protein